MHLKARILSAVLTATSVIAAAAPVAFAGPTYELKRSVDLGTTPLRPVKYHFGCVVSGTPTEFPDDIKILNTYAFATPAGLTVAYTAPYGNSGVVTLPALAPGQFYLVSNAIPGGHPAGGACTAKQI